MAPKNTEFYMLCGVKVEGGASLEKIAASRSGGPALLSAMVVLEDLLRLPKLVDDATVPKAGMEAAPGQVVFNMSISYARIKRIQHLLGRIKEILDETDQQRL